MEILSLFIHPHFFPVAVQGDHIVHLQKDYQKSSL